MSRAILQSILSILCIAAGLQAQDRDTLIRSVRKLPGWTTDGKSAVYNESNLDQLNPVLATKLRLYGVDGVSVQEWRSPFGPVKATLFQLVHSASAYGFFTIQRKSEANSTPSPVGAEGFQAGNRRYFWQSRYVVRLEGDPRAVDALASKLSEEIVGLSQRPTVTNHLPAANLVAGSEEYILSASDVPKLGVLNSIDIGFDDSAEVAAADYRINGKTIHLILVLYPTPQIAKKYAERISDSTANSSAETQKRIGPLLAIVSGTSDPSISQLIMDQMHYGSKVMWDEPKPGLGLGPLIITIFTFIGLLLGACLIAGISLGGVRVWMKKRFPNRVFDRDADTEIIQLKLDQ